MTLLDFIVLLLIAGLCGAIGQAISGFSRGGCLVSIALGFIASSKSQSAHVNSSQPFGRCSRVLLSDLSLTQAVITE